MDTYVIGAILGALFMVVGLVSMFLSVLVPRYRDEIDISTAGRGGSLTKASGVDPWTSFDKLLVWLLKQFNALIKGDKVRKQMMRIGLVSLVIGVLLLGFSIYMLSTTDSKDSESPSPTKPTPTALSRSFLS